MDHEIEQFKIKTTVQNKNFDFDMEYAIKLNRWLLKPFGIWPLNSSSTKFDRGISVISPSICCLLLFFVMIPSFVAMFVSEKDFKGKLEIVGPTSFIIMVVLKYFFLITRGDTLKMCIDTLISDWRNVHAKHTFLPVLTAKSLARGNKLTIRLVLFFSCNFILFDPYVRPIFEIVYIAHCFCSVIVYSITTEISSLAAKFVIHACGQCEIVIPLQNIIDSDKRCLNVVEKNLLLLFCDIYMRSGKIIILQVKGLLERPPFYGFLTILRMNIQYIFVTNVEDLLNQICFVEFLVGTTVYMGKRKCTEAHYSLFLWTLLNSILHLYMKKCHQIEEPSYMIH
uniref:Odorant receptor 10 n=1 Tax=Cephus cinctus TaxID=211228 RepID=A0A1W6L198_CEPCN|nr:odorant receptor 10 [Cephus cinctus]